MNINIRMLLKPWILFLVTCVYVDVSAEGIEVLSARSSLVDEQYILDAAIDFTLNEEVIEAIDHGVSLYIDIVVRIKRQRKWMWDKTAIEQVYSYKLEKHALSDDYIVTYLNLDSRQQVSSLDDALSVIGIISELELIPAIALIEGRNYSGRLMAQLDVEELPPPLRPIAYTSKAWKLKSEWYEWDIRILDEK